MSWSVSDTTNRIVRSRHAPLVAVIIAFSMLLPTLTHGLFMDDYVLLARVFEGATPWNLFAWVNAGQVEQAIEHGENVWWAHPDLRIAFLRPIASATHWLDFHSWPDQAWLFHLQNLTLYGALIFVSGLAFRRFSSTTAVAGTAVILLAVNEANVWAVAWISGRSMLLAAIFGVGALLAHDRWRRGHWRTGMVLAPFLLSLSLLSAEAGLAFVGYLLAHALCLEKGSPMQRLLVMLPYIGVVVIWRIIYTVAGYGAKASGYYLDIGSEPINFAWGALQSMFVQSFGQLGWPSAVLIDWIPFGSLLAAALLALVLFVLRPILRSDPVSRFYLVGMLLSAAPFGATAFAQPRLLLPLALGAFGFIAQVLWYRGLEPGIIWVKRSFILFHAILAPLACLVVVLIAFKPFQLLQAHVEQTVQQIPEKDVIVMVNAPTAMISAQIAGVAAGQGKDLPDHIYYLHTGRGSLTLRRTGERTLELSATGWLGDTKLDRIFRARRYPFAEGDVVSLERMVVEVLEVDHGDPQRVRIEFEDDFEDIGWLAWGPEAAQPFVPPPVGGRSELAISW